MNDEKAFLTSLDSAFSTVFIYHAGHPAIEKSTGEMFTHLQSLFRKGKTVELMIVDDDLIMNRGRVRGLKTSTCKVAKALLQTGITKVEFREGVTLDEVQTFIEKISVNDAPPRSSGNIILGCIDISKTKQLGDEKPATAPSDEKPTTAPSSENRASVEEIKELYQDIQRLSKIDIIALEQVARNITNVLQKGKNILNLLKPVRNHSEYTYIHALNVSSLTVFQVTSLGANEETIREVGMAALMHDIGKLFIPKEILNKKGRLNEREFEEVKKHPFYGAKYWLKMNHNNRIGPVIAYEHHMRYDGLGYPGNGHRNRKPHILSQIVQISDFFDAMRSRRPYKRDWSTEEIFGLMRKTSGTEFNPFLLENFIEGLTASIGKTSRKTSGSD